MTVWRMGLHSVKKRIWLTFPYDEAIKTELKLVIPGGRWEPTEKLWHYPLDMEVARDIRDLARAHGAIVRVEPELAQWAKIERNRYSSLIKPDDLQTDQSQMLPRCRQTYPDLIKAMAEKPWQIPGAQFIAGQRRVLLADEPGLGKTIQVLASVIENDVNGLILVIAPKTAVTAVWPEQIAQWLGTDERVFVISGSVAPAERSVLLTAAANRAARGERVWILAGPNYLRIKADLDDKGNYARDAKGAKVIRVVGEARPEIFSMTFAAVIVDESHESLAVSKGDKKKWSAQRRGLGALHLEPNAMQIAMSGTPFRGKTEYAWGTLNWIAPDKYTSIWNWYRRHYGVVQANGGFGAAIAKGDKILDEKKFFTELKSYMVRRTKAEVAPWLPPKFYAGTRLDPADTESPVAVWLPMSDRQTKQYNQIEKDALLTLSELVEINVNGTLAEMTRFKQVANSCLTATTLDKAMPVIPSNKLDWIVDFLKERKEAGTKVIVASQFTQFLVMLSAFLRHEGLGHYLFTGMTKDADRAKIRREFQGDGEQFILLNTKSGGMSLTLDEADDVVICDQTWIPDDQTQVEDRAHRISRNHKVTIWYLASLKTIDEDVARVNAQREDALTSILDRQRGVSYVKAIIAAARIRSETK